MIDEAFVDKKEWTRKTILSTARMGKFSSDRCVIDYCEEIWGAEPLRVPDHRDIVEVGKKLVGLGRE